MSNKYYILYPVVLIILILAICVDWKHVFPTDCKRVYVERDSIDIIHVDKKCGAYKSWFKSGTCISEFELPMYKQAKFRFCEYCCEQWDINWIVFNSKYNSSHRKEVNPY